MNILLYIYRAVAILIGMVCHEWAHGFASYKLGDPTPKRDGRLSPNPIKHIDPVGAICLLIGGFGWAKPVQVNPQYYKDEKKGMAITAIAGPLTNLIISSIAISLNKHFFGMGSEFLFVVASINLSLFIFNLIPLPPLDGSKIAAMFLPYNIYEKYMMLERYGFIILMVLVMGGAFNGFLSTALSFVFGLLYSIL
jgi:Zn-dependent protease